MENLSGCPALDLTRGSPSYKSLSDRIDEGNASLGVSSQHTFGEAVQGDAKRLPTFLQLRRFLRLRLQMLFIALCQGTQFAAGDRQQYDGNNHAEGNSSDQHYPAE